MGRKSYFTVIRNKNSIFNIIKLCTS